MLRLAMVALLGGLLLQPADARPRDERRSAAPSHEQQRHERGGKSRGGERGEREDDGERRRSAQAARQAQRLNGGGRVLSVSPEAAGYRVKLLKDGEVRTFVVPGE